MYICIYKHMHMYAYIYICTSASPYAPTRKYKSESEDMSSAISGWSGPRTAERMRMARA